MILERIAIDYRCQDCLTIRRVDAALDKTVLEQMPGGWVVETLGVTCPRCTTGVEAPTAKERADVKREEVRKLRMPTAEVSTLISPVAEAISPLVSDTCTRCGNNIGEAESWRPDPRSMTFAKAHRACLLKSAEFFAKIEESQ